MIKCIYSTPIEVEAYLVYLIDLAFYAQISNEPNVFQEAKSMYNITRNEWNSKFDTLTKRTLYDKIMGYTSLAWKIEPFDEKLEKKRDSHNFIVNIVGEDTAMKVAEDSFKKLRNNPKDEIARIKEALENAIKEAENTKF